MDLKELTFSNFLAARQIDEEIQARYGEKIKEKNDFFMRIREKIEFILNIIVPWPNRNFEYFTLSTVKQNYVEIKIIDERDNEQLVEFPTAWLSLEGKALIEAIHEEENTYKKSIFSTQKQ